MFLAGDNPASNAAAAKAKAAADAKAKADADAKAKAAATKAPPKPAAVATKPPPIVAKPKPATPPAPVVAAPKPFEAGPPIFATYRTPPPVAPTTKPVTKPTVSTPVKLLTDSKPIAASPKPFEAGPPVYATYKRGTAILLPPDPQPDLSPSAPVSTPPQSTSSYTPVATATSTIAQDAAAYRPGAPPITVSTPITQAVDKAIDTQKTKTGVATTKATVAQGALDDNGRALAGIDTQEQNFDKPIQIAGAEKRRAALAASTPKLTTQRDAAVADRDYQQKTLGVMTTTGDVIKLDAQGTVDAKAGATAKQRADADYKAFKAAVPTSTLVQGQKLDARDRANLPFAQQQVYDQYASSQVASSDADSATQAHAASGLAARLGQQVFVEDPQAKGAIKNATRLLDTALAPQGVRVTMPQSIDERLPGARNADARAATKAALPGMFKNATDFAAAANANWDYNTSLLKAQDAGVLADKGAAALAPDGVATIKPSEKTLAVDRELAVKGAYLTQRNQALAIDQTGATLGDAKAALAAFDHKGGAFTDPARTKLVGDVATAQTSFDLANESGIAAQKDFVAAIGAQDAADHPGDQGFTAAAGALQLDANLANARLATDTLTPQVATLKQHLADAPASQASGGASDPRVSQLMDLESQLAKATGARTDADAASKGMTLRNGFLDALPTDLRDAKTDDQKTDFAQKQYDFFKDNPAALAGLDAKTQDALKQDPGKGEGDWLGSTLEAVGGGLMVAAGAAMSTTGLGAVVGVPLALEGANMLVHGTKDLINGETTDGFITQGLEATGVGRSDARRWDTGIQMVASIPGGAAGLAKAGITGLRSVSELGTTLRGLEITTGGALLLDQGQAQFRSSVLNDRTATPYSAQALMGLGFSSSQASALTMLGAFAVPGIRAIRSAKPTVTSTATGPSAREKLGRAIVGTSSALVAGGGTYAAFRGFLPLDLVSGAYAYRGARAFYQAAAQQRLTKLQSDVPANLGKLDSMLVKGRHVFGLSDADHANYAKAIQAVRNGTKDANYHWGAQELQGAKLFTHPTKFALGLDMIASASLASTIGGKVGSWLHGDFGGSAPTFAKDALFDIGNNTLNGTTTKAQLKAFKPFANFQGGKLLKAFPSVTMGTYGLGGALNAGLEFATLSPMGAVNGGLWSAFAYGASRQFAKNLVEAYPSLKTGKASGVLDWMTNSKNPGRPLMALGAALFLAKGLEIALRDTGASSASGPSVPGVVPTPTAPTTPSTVPSGPSTTAPQPGTGTPSTSDQPKAKHRTVAVDSHRADRRTLTGIAAALARQSHGHLTFRQALDQIYAANPRFDRSRDDGRVTAKPPGDPDYLRPGWLIDTGMIG